MMYRSVIVAGAIPTMDEDVVSRQICAVGLYDDDCEHSFDVRVKSCGDFRVYELQPSLGCPSAYCLGNTAQPRLSVRLLPR